MTDALLVADCVTKSFGDRHVLSAGSLRAVTGEWRALMGRNGAGKSTLLKIAAGWIAPDAGAVRYDGAAAARFHLHDLAKRGVFYLPDRELLSPSLSVRRQLEMFRVRFGGADVGLAAERMGIAELLDQLPHQLSSGEQRRAEIAAMIVRRPRCILADEPFRGLSPIDAEVLNDQFRAFAAEGCAVITTGHEITVFLDRVDHVTWCTSGTTYELGAPSHARRDSRFSREFLGWPAA
jgi:ABC-type multidrug transport system ATPase subunit